MTNRHSSKIGWQTVPCSWSIDGEAALTGSSLGTRDQQSQTPWNIVAGDHAQSGPAHTQVSQISRDCIVKALPHKHRRLVGDSLAHWKPVQANKDRRDVVVMMSPGDQAGRRVLH